MSKSKNFKQNIWLSSTVKISVSYTELRFILIFSCKFYLWKYQVSFNAGYRYLFCRILLMVTLHPRKEKYMRILTVMTTRNRPIKYVLDEVIFISLVAFSIINQKSTEDFSIVLNVVILYYLNFIFISIR